MTAALQGIMAAKHDLCKILANWGSRRHGR